MKYPNTSLAALSLLVAAWPSNAWANDDCATDFQNLYGSGPDTTYASANCQTCHTSGIPALNSYGNDVGSCSVAAIEAAEDEDSDTLGSSDRPNVPRNDGGDNLTEITAGAQPGWCEPLPNRPCDNVGPPPDSITGRLDPVPQGSSGADLLWRAEFTGFWELYTYMGLNQTSGGSAFLPFRPGFQPVGRADLDGDGIGDVLLRYEGPGPSAGRFESWLLVDRTVTGHAVLDTIKDLDYAVISNDDFGGDAKGDLLLRKDTGDWLMYQIDGITVASSGVPTLPTDTSIVPRATGDFNGDERADVLMSRGDGTWEMYLMDGPIILDNGQPALPKLAVWEILAIEDYNADGKADLLMRRSDTGLWKLFLMDGDTVLEEREVIRNYKAPRFRFQSAEDFNGDGRADILIRNFNKRIWWLFLMDGTSVIDKGVADIPRGSSRLRSTFVHAEDLNNDGKADVIISFNGTRVILMDGVNPRIDMGRVAPRRPGSKTLIVD